MVEAKKVVVDVALGRATIEDARESLRLQLVDAMRYGQTLYIRLADSAADFMGSLCDDACFPVAVFDRAAVDGLVEYREGSVKNLWGSDHPFASVLREADLGQGGVFQPRYSHKTLSERADGVVDGFEVVCCTQFGPSEFASMLASALPLPRLQPIWPQPSTARLRYSHYDFEFALDVGGTLHWATLDERFSLSLVFRGCFVVTLVEQPPPPPPESVARPVARGRARFARAPPPSVDDDDDGERPRIRADEAGVFRGLVGGAAYAVRVAEDAEAEAAAASGEARTSRVSAAALGAAAATAAALTRSAPPGAKALPGRSDDGRTQTAALLEAELARLTVSDGAAAGVRGERSERYRELREALAAQDVIFGGG